MPPVTLHTSPGHQRCAQVVAFGLVLLIAAGAYAQGVGAMSQTHGEAIMTVLKEGRPKLVGCEPIAEAHLAQSRSGQREPQSPLIVEVRVWINADGSVDTAAVTESSGVELLDRCVGEEIERWVFPDYHKSVRVLTRWYF